jgi:hypothetical protein
VKLAQRATHVEVNIVDDTDLSGSTTFTGSANPGAYTLCFFAAFNRPMKHWRLIIGADGQRSARMCPTSSDEHGFSLIGPSGPSAPCLAPADVVV